MPFFERIFLNRQVREMLDMYQFPGDDTSGKLCWRWQSDRKWMWLAWQNMAELCHMHPHSDVPETVLPITHSLDFIVPAYAQNDDLVGRTEKPWPHKMTFRHVSTFKIIMWCNNCNKSHQRQDHKAQLEAVLPQAFHQGLSAESFEWGLRRLWCSSHQAASWQRFFSQWKQGRLPDRLPFPRHGQVDGCSGYPLPRSWEVWSLFRYKWLKWPGQRCWYVLMVGNWCFMLGTDCS